MISIGIFFREDLKVCISDCVEDLILVILQLWEEPEHLGERMELGYGKHAFEGKLRISPSNLSL